MFFSPKIKEWGFSTQEGEEVGSNFNPQNDHDHRDDTLIVVEDDIFSGGKHSGNNNNNNNNNCNDNQTLHSTVGSGQNSSSFYKPLDDTPAVKFGLPEGSIYSSAIIIPFGASSEEYKSFWRGIIAMLVVLPHWILVFFNMFAQATFIYYISENFIGSSGSSTKTCTAPFLLQLSGLLVFSGVIFADILETLRMVVFIYLFPSARGHQALTLEQRQVKSNDSILFEEEDAMFIASGMRWWYKFLVGVLFLLPKLVIAGALLYFGSLFIVRSNTNEDLILNTLSVTFIIEIDEILFRATAPSFIKRVLEHLPKLPRSRNTPLTKMLGGVELIFGPYINVAVLSTFTLLFQYYLC